MKKILVFASILLTLYAIASLPSFAYSKGAMLRYTEACQSTSAINLVKSLSEANESMGGMAMFIILLQLIITLALAYDSRNKQK